MAPHARNRLGAAIALAILLLLAAPTITIAAAASNCPPGAGGTCTRPGVLAASLSEEEAEEEAEELEAEELEEEGLEAEEAEPAEEEAEEAEWEGEEELEEGEEEARRSPQVGGNAKRRRSSRQHTAARISKLSLTRRTRTALRRRHLTASSIAFSFRLDMRSKVHVTLTRNVHSRSHVRVRTVRSLSTTGKKGTDHAQLRGHAHLTPGRYRLTLTPARGRSRSISFRVR